MNSSTRSSASLSLSDPSLPSCSLHQIHLRQTKAHINLTTQFPESILHHRSTFISMSFAEQMSGLNGTPLQWDDYDFYDPSILFDSITWVHSGVGPSQRVFGIHKGLLCYHSFYFRAALIGSWSETAAANNTVVLDDEDPELFSCFNIWLYGQRFDLRWTFDELLDLYIFASRRLMRHFQNAIVDEMLIRVKIEGATMSTPLLNRAWNSAPRLHAFLVDVVVEKCDMNYADDIEDELLSAVTRRSTDLWRQSRIEWPIDEYGDREEMYVMRVAKPFGLSCERYHVHERKDNLCSAKRQIQQ